MQKAECRDQILEASQPVIEVSELMIISGCERDLNPDIHRDFNFVSASL